MFTFILTQKQCNLMARFLCYKIISALPILKKRKNELLITWKRQAPHAILLIYIFRILFNQCYAQ